MPASPDFDREAVELYRSGLTMLEVGRRLGSSEKRVLNALRRRGEPRRTRGGPARPERAKEILELYRRLGSAADAAAAAGVSRDRVYEVLRANGIRLRPKLDIDIEKAAELYRSGLSLEEVGRRFGMTAMPMRHRLIAAGVKMRPRGTVPRGQSAGMVRDS